MDLNRNHQRVAAISREADLLIACGAACATDKTADLDGSLATNTIDWKLFKRMAAGHGMSSIVWRALTAHADLVPADIWAGLCTRHRVVAARNLYLANE